jgi:tripartite-type tricarboxylate transporter receptor subunit TctC
MFAAPPDLPERVRSKLVGVVQAALQDPGLAEWGKTAQFPLDLGSAEKAKQLYVEQKAFLTGYKALLTVQ